MNTICILVGMTGLEPAASWSQTTRSTKLSYIPILQFKVSNKFNTLHYTSA